MEEPVGRESVHSEKKFMSGLRSLSEGVLRTQEAKRRPRRIEYGDALGSLVGDGAIKTEKSWVTLGFPAIWRTLDTILRTTGSHLRALAREAHGLICMLHLLSWL